MGPGALQIVMVDRLIDALERAKVSSRSGDFAALGDALAEALGALGGLYGTLDASGRHPEASHELSIVYDMCLRHVAMVHRGRPEMLDLSLGCCDRYARRSSPTLAMNRRSWSSKPTTLSRRRRRR
ncbi:hypothetical protein AKJ09_07483 [Labilithrix luteola]|uniref:Uncharacterized protein n=1 Tax=Labilithrix luteola TaxID=1391654 RepID=A0A0K1Q5Z6_9BACT|nr:flagellar protein FliS [Labilithrix luteola]AKV00820.1 hypothetical protein AKJ09_07483 [Labilithrix luteola]